MVMLTWGLEKARETFIHGIRRKMNNHSLGNRQMCYMRSVSWNGLITQDLAKVGVGFHLGKRNRNWITHPIANGCVVSRKGKGQKKGTWLTFYHWVCSTRKDNSQATQWLGNDWGAFVVHKSLLRGCWYHLKVWKFHQ